MAAVATSIKLDPDIRGRVQRLADARQRSAHWLLREAVEQYVSREEKREQARHDALAAWSEYEATDLHATQDEVDAWLAVLEAGEDAPPPACHD